MSSRKAFLDCIQAKANAQLDTTRDRISDPKRAEELKYMRNVTSAKLNQHLQVLDEILEDDISTPELRAQARAAIDGMIDTFQVKAAGKARSFMIGQKGANFVKESAKRGYGSTTTAAAFFWASPHLRGSDIDASAQVLPMEDIFRSHRNNQLGLLNSVVSIFNDEAKIFYHTQNKEVADLIYKDMFDMTSGMNRTAPKIVQDASNKLAKYDDNMITELRARGVAIPEGGRKNYIAGKVLHNVERLSQIPEEKYVAEMIGLYNSGGLNKELIENAIPGNLTPAKLEVVFKAIYKAEVGQELDVVPKSLGSRVQSLHKTKEMHRILEFNDYESMKKFDSMFGYDNGWEKFNGLADRNIRTLAMLDTLGADKAASAQQMRASMVKRYGAEGGEAFDREYSHAIRHYGTGFKNPLNPNVSSNVSGIRSFISSNLLGKHPVGAITTDWSVNLPKTFAVMGRSYFAPFAEGMKNIAYRLTGNFAERDALLKTLGGEVENLMMDMQASIHSTNATQVAKLGGAAYKMVEIASLNRLVTKTNRRLANVTFSNTLAQHIETGGAYGEGTSLMGMLLHGTQKKATFSAYLQGFGISKQDILKLKPYLNKKAGLTYLDAEKIPTGLNDIRNIYMKILAAQAAAVESASPTSSARFAAMLGAMKEGGKGRALAIDLHSMFLGYITSMLQNNILPLLKAKGTGFHKVKAFAAYGTLLTTAGVITEWVYDLIKGRDPQPTSETLILKGMMRAGFLGPAMDYVGSMFLPQSSKDGIVGSPVIDKAESAIRAGTKVAQGKEGGVSDSINFLGNLLPGSAIWWIETIYKQGILHHLREVADPKGTKAADKRKKVAAKRDGTEYFVQPDGVLPEVVRAPNLANVKPKG